MRLHLKEFDCRGAPLHMVKKSIFTFVFGKIELFLITIDPDKDPRKYGTLPLLPTYNIKSMFPLNS